MLHAEKDHPGHSRWLDGKPLRDDCYHNGHVRAVQHPCPKPAASRRPPAGGVLLGADQVEAVNIPGTSGNNNRFIGARGTRLLVRAQTGCPGSDSLLWFDPAIRAVQMLLPAPSNVIGVLGAIPRSR